MSIERTGGDGAAFLATIPKLEVKMEFQRRGDSVWRSGVKTLVYRALMFLVTFLVALFFTADPVSSTGISIGANVIKTVTYIIYERIWDRVDWGRSHS